VASNNSPRQLNINCTVSAVYLPEQGSIFGAYSRGKQQKDPSNTLSATFYEQIERNKYSPNIATLSSGAGGLIPKLNLLIGAPAATFAEGAIVPGKAHPILNLLKGGIYSKFSPETTYTVPQGSAENTLRENTQPISSGTGVSFVYPPGSFPFVPMAKVGPFESLKERSTYNIWTQQNVDQTKLTYLLNTGVVNYKAAGGNSVHTTVTQNGARVTVHAQGKPCILRRIFPIADDFIYDNTDEGKCKLYYPSVNNIINPPEDIKAKGGPNCGFWIHLDITNPSRVVTKDSAETSQLLVYWGYKNELPAKRRITEFVIVFTANQAPSLRYKRPGTQSNTIQSILNNWGRVDLNGPTFGSSNKVDIFVHYAGSNMYIGFDPDISTWNVFEPIKVDQLTEESSDDSIYEPYTPEKSIIEIYFKNIASSFTYSPICFNNFNADYISPANNDARNRIVVNFNVPEKEYLTGSCSPTQLKQGFITKRKPIYTDILGTGESDSPTFYGDWRRRNASDSDYFDTPEFSYEENNVVTDNTVPDNKRTLVTGQINYETTIEGPVFFYFRNFPESAQRDLITRPIWGNYSDISSYLTSARVSVNYNRENRNNSYQTASATLTFANLTNDLVGIQILNAIQENTLVFTLKAGYDSKLNTFFQGIARDVTVSRTPDGFTINVSCQDLGDALLSDIRFNTTSSYSMNNRNLKRMLEESFYFAGLINVYEPRPERTDGTYDALYKNFFNKVIGALGLNFPTSLARDVITVDKSKVIKNVVKTVLNLMLYTPGDPFSRDQGLPVLYWNPGKHRYVLSLRSDEPQDSLFFAGDNSDPNGIIQLANSNPDREHGIVESQGWTESTRISNLHSKVIFATKLHDLSIFYKESSSKSINNALSSTSLEKLNQFVRNPSTNTDIGSYQSQPVLGYVGYHKEYLAIDEATNFFQNEAIAREQFSFREKFARETYTAIKLNVFVTKPLNTSGTFVIKSFEGGSENQTGSYIYANVDYTFDIDNNIIRASIDGERFPDIIGE
jgi:hypothetical protein